MVSLSFHSFMVLLSLQVVHCLTAAVYNITSSTPLFANETLVSPNEVYELGFFIPNGSGNQYVGIWYKNKSVSKVVWVANRENPIDSSDQLASLIIQSDGNLWLVDGKQTMVWSTNVTSDLNSTEVELLDSGNLVIKDRNSGSYIWQSFDEPCDTLLPGMQIGINAKTGERRYLISWKTDTDPSAGTFILGITSETPPQVFGWNGSVPYIRGGQWDKSRFTGLPGMANTYLSGFSLVQDVQQEKTYFSINVYNSFIGYLFFSPEGLVKLNHWDEGLKKWSTNWEMPVNLCQRYGECGPFGVCNSLNSPICSCPKGFVAKSIEEWSKGNWTAGCIRQMELNCQRNASMSTSVSAKKDVFWKMSQMKLPDSAEFLSNIKDKAGCQSWCLSICSCLAYSYVDTIGCMIWVKDLMDIQQFNVSGEDLFLRLADLQAGTNRAPLVIGLCGALGIIILAAAVYGFTKRRAQQKENMLKQKSRLHLIHLTNNSGNKLQEDEWREQLKKEDASDLTIFSLESISAATDDFSAVNKLGQGGFGSVYKGKLWDGKEIAVKRLSSSSRQGLEEFKNEIILISKLRHRNLVRLLGCCIEGEEKILVYEYLSNKSLDTFLFDPTRKEELNWDICFCIIHGIARGLLYLHRDSYARVIHRDLKVSNILLDEKMNPKISDFGLARMFEGTREWVNTYRVVGTLGYMSPEYAMGGIFSEKSDVYSFGVLLLEIVSSKKNSPIYYQGQYLNLLSYAWELWNRGKAMDFAAEAFVDASSQSQIVKCIQIGLLCVQDHAVDRPDMSSVVIMLSGESDLPRPKQPTFTFQSLSVVQSQQESALSTNEVTTSIVEGR